MANKTLVFVKDLMEGRRGWFYDTYTPDIMVHYGEEGSGIHSILCGGANGTVYQLTGTSDAGTAIACHVITKALDQGDPRHNKLYGDIMLDANTNGVAITAIPKFDNLATSGSTTTVNTASRLQTPVAVGTEWVVAKNIALDLAWSVTSAKPILYIWEPRYTEEGANLYALEWETSYITHGAAGYFYHGWLYINHISTADLTFVVRNEGGTALTTTIIPHSNGVRKKDFIRLPTMKTKLAKYELSSTAAFRIDGEESELLIKQWGNTGSWNHVKIFKDVPIGNAA